VEPAPIDDVLRRHRDRLLSLPGVNAVAASERGGRPCLLVLVNRLTDHVREAIPATLGGHPVVVEEGGPFQRID
jgi:hypothetical protein